MNVTLNPSSIAGEINDLTRRAADQADSAIDSAQRLSQGALDTLQDKVHAVRDQAPGALSRAAAQVDDLKRRGIDAAHKVKTTVQDQAQRAGDRTVGYIKDEPLKSVLIAAATGAAVAALITMLARSRSSARN